MAVAAAGLAGCGPSDDIEVRHNLPREKERDIPGANTATAPGQTPGAAPGMPGRENIPIAYTAPAGWREEAASGFRNASFLISGGTAEGAPANATAAELNGTTADCSISTLSIQGSNLLENVNRWRAQVKLGPLTSEALGQNCREEHIDGQRWIWVEITGAAPAPSPAQELAGASAAPSPSPAAEPAAAPVAPMMQPKSGNPARFAQRIVAGIFVAPPRVWFIKLSGDEPLVTTQVEAFRGLLKSFRFASEPGGTPMPPGKAQTLTGQPAAAPQPVPTAPAPSSTPGADPHAGATPEQMEQMRARMRATGELAERQSGATTTPAPGSSAVPAPAPAPATSTAPSPAPATIATNIMGGPVPAGAAVSKPAWKLPAGWEEKEARPPRIATISIPAPAGAPQGTGPAEVSITAFPGDVGGVLANVNRWRGQIGLQPITGDELAKQAQPFPLRAGDPVPATPAATLFYYEGPSATLLAAIVSKDGSSWFFKATGPAATLAPQKQAMIDFVQSCGF
ncbi:hypothetical protein DB346_17080 [Verrucomicrobia bacterium LW23]|nr:hypothetical protein DB346_17080 [Verrucomicrobia bacterium LW23]